MQVAVIGAGAVGCYYGGLLLKAGHDVTFFGRPVHVDAINAQGLLLDTQSFKGHLPAKAAADTDGRARPCQASRRRQSRHRPFACERGTGANA